MQSTSREVRVLGNLRVGKAQVDPAAPAHQRGIRQGNEAPGSVRAHGVHHERRLFATGSAERSTGINPKARNPIDPDMPNLSPA
jgi:hypothetical protein